MTSTQATATAHKIRWYVWAGGTKIPRESTMRGMWGYDATCSCGWETRTGGAVRSYVEREVWIHKALARSEAANEAAS